MKGNTAMKKTHVSLLTALLLLVCTVFTLSACSGGGAGGEGGGGNSVEIFEGQTYYDAGTKVVFLTDGRASSVNASGVLMSAMEGIAADGFKPVVGSASDAASDYEVIIGYVPERPVSVRAYELLDRIDSSSPLAEARYLIYAKGGTIAFAYDENYYSDLQIIDFAVDDFIGEHVAGKTSITIDAGEVMSDVINLIDVQAQLDKEMLDDLWEQVSSKYSASVYQGMRTYYNVFSGESSDITAWFANLYDPDLGGFYATATGRDEINIFPDIQSTAEIFEFIIASGMLDDLDGGIAKYLPNIVKCQLIWYAKSIQDENGYFYMTQLGKDILDSEEVEGALERRESDLRYAESLLDILGAQPTYDTPNGVKGDGMTADQYWATTGYADELKPEAPEYVVIEDEEGTEGEEGTEDENGAVTAGLSTSVTTAVSKAVDAAAIDDDFVSVIDVEPLLESHRKFSQYGRKVGFHIHPLEAAKQVPYDFERIKEASEDVGPYKSGPSVADDERPAYEGKTYVDMLFDMLIDMLNAEGLYGTTHTNDGSDQTIGAEMLNAYAFDVIIDFYNDQGLFFEAASKSARGLLKCLGGFEYSENIKQVSDIWEILCDLIDNVNKYASADEKAAFFDNYKAAIDELGGNAFIVSSSRQSTYQKVDGGFGHLLEGCNSTGAAGLVIGTGEENESEVSAVIYSGPIAARAMCKAIGVDYIPIYTEADWLRFIDELLKIDPVIKYDRDLYKEPPITIFDFNEIPAKFFQVKSGVDYEMEIVEVEKFGMSDNVLYINKLAAGTQTLVTCGDALIQNPAATMTVFSFDIMMTRMGAASQMEISITNQSSTSHADKPILFLIQHKGTANGSDIQIIPYHNRKSEKAITIRPKVGEWFNIRVEYYEGTGTLDTVRTKYYIDDELIYTTNGVMGDNVVGGYTPLPMAEKINYASIAMNMALTGEFYMDNITLRQTTTQLEDGTIGIPPAYQAYLDSLQPKTE